MKTMNATEAKTKFGELLSVVSKEPVSIKKNGRSVAVVISLEDYERSGLGDQSAESLEDRVLKSHVRSMEKWGKLYEVLAK